MVLKNKGFVSFRGASHSQAPPLFFTAPPGVVAAMVNGSQRRKRQRGRRQRGRRQRRWECALPPGRSRRAVGYTVRACAPAATTSTAAVRNRHRHRNRKRHRNRNRNGRVVNSDGRTHPAAFEVSEYSMCFAGGSCGGGREEPDERVV